jgi:hypothetical protein
MISHILADRLAHTADEFDICPRVTTDQSQPQFEFDCAGICSIRHCFVNNVSVLFLNVAGVLEIVARRVGSNCVPVTPAE